MDAATVNGTTAIDVVSGNNANMYPSSTLDPAGKIGEAIRIGEQGIWFGTLQFTDDFSFSAWIAPDNINIDRYVFYNQSLTLVLSGTQPVFYVTLGTSTNYSLAGPSNGVVLNGAWQHIAVTRNRSSGEARMYVNGVLVASQVQSTAPIAAISSAWTLGKQTEWWFEGRMDDVRLYSSTLTASQVAALAGLPPTSGGPHAVTAAGGTAYAYDANGNMTARGAQTLTWNAENRLASVSGGESYVYDAEGVRVKKVAGGQTTVYPNKYYEKNTSTGVITTYYYLGGRLVALKRGGTVEYVLQDHLGGANVTTDGSGNAVASRAYYPYGSMRTSTGTLGTDRQFTGHRLDASGLYFMQGAALQPTSAALRDAPLTVTPLYNGRPYDPGLARFVQPDALVPDPRNPQSLNRYAYVVNNPLRYTDPDGQCPWCIAAAVVVVRGAATSAIGYTMGTIALNQASGRPLLEGFNGRDLAEATAIGAATGGASAIRAVSQALRSTAPVILGTIGSETQYAVDVYQGQSSLSAGNLLRIGAIGAASGAAEMRFAGSRGVRAFGVGIAAATGGDISSSLSRRMDGWGSDPPPVGPTPRPDPLLGPDQTLPSWYFYDEEY